MDLVLLKPGLDELEGASLIDGIDAWEWDGWGSGGRNFLFVRWGRKR